MNNYSNVKVKVFGSPKEFKSYDIEDEPKITELMYKEVLPKFDIDYYEVDVKVMRKKDQTPDHLVAYMLRKESYTADVIKIEIDGNIDLLDIIENYDDSIEEDEEEDHFDEEDEYGSYDFIVSTPVDNIASAKDAVIAIYNEAKNAGLKPRMLLGSQANRAYYKYYLQSGVKGFVNIGHGYSGGIVLHDGTLTASWFQGLSDKPLNPAVVYFNSCKVFNDPLKSAIMKAGARTYIGGITNLLIGPSEQVCRCFWDNVKLKSLKCMGNTIRACEKLKYPNVGSHGLIGEYGPFKDGWHSNKSVIRTHTKYHSQMAWVLFNQSCWIRIRPQSPDGVTNLLMIFSQALANNRKVDVYIRNGQIQEATLR